MLRSASVKCLSDSVLLRALKSLVERDCALEAELLGYLGEVDARGIHLERGFSSMIQYCMRELHFSEAVAYHRITAARAVRKFPLLLERIRSGEIHLSGVKELLPQLTKENQRELLDRAKHRSKAEIREMVADLAPRPAVPSRIRELPARPRESAPLSGAAGSGSADRASGSFAEPASGGGAELPAPAPVAPSCAWKERTRPPEPLGLGRYEVRFTAHRALRGKLEELQALLRHQIPDGDLAKIIDRAVSLLLEEVKRQKFGKVKNPRSESSASGRRSSDGSSRHIPAEIKRQVAERDGERCSYVSPEGRRCESRAFLEYDHRSPWAKVRRHHTKEIALLCRAHNQHAAIREFGREHIERCRRERSNSRRRELGDGVGPEESDANALGPDPPSGD